MSTAALVQCTFHGNSAAAGSNISADCDGHITVDGCIITGGVGSAGVYVNGGSSAIFSCTDIWGNPAGDWVAPFANQLVQDGNINDDPFYCDTAAHDFTLAELSPCAPEHSGDCGQIGAWPVGCSGPLAVEPVVAPSGLVVLEPNVPNPFNPATTLRFTIPVAGRVLLAIHGVDGRRLTVLVNGPRSAGAHEVTWRGLDRAGRAVPSGIYVAVLEASGERRSRNLVLLR